jgi:hypothetical protein
MLLPFLNPRRTAFFSNDWKKETAFFQGLESAGLYRTPLHPSIGGDKAVVLLHGDPNGIRTRVFRMKT